MQFLLVFRQEVGFVYTLSMKVQNKLGLSCAKLSSSWLQAYTASDYKIIQGANIMVASQRISRRLAGG